MSHDDDLDEDRLRHALTMIGDEATRDEPLAGPSRTAETSPPSRWRRPAVLVAAGIVAVVGIVAGVVDATDEGDPGPDATRALNDPQEIACARQIFKGRIKDVTATSKRSEVRMTVAVDDWIKPSDPQREAITFQAGSAAYDDIPRYHSGQRVLAIVRARPSAVIGGLALVFRGDNLAWKRRDIMRALPEAKHTNCPDWWRHPDRYPAGPDDS